MNSFRKHIKKKLSGYEPEVNDMSLHESWKQTEHLLSKRNESRSRLDNFEPEAGDDHIHEKWKAIIPYLPEEKKKRALFYIPLGCLLPGALLLLPMLFVMHYYFRTYNEKPTGVTGKYQGVGGHAVAAVQQKGISRKGTASGKVPGLNRPEDMADLTATSGKTGSITTAVNSVTLNTYALNGTRPEKPEILFSDTEQVRGNVFSEREGVIDSVYCMAPLYCFPARSISDSLLKKVCIIHDTVPVKRSSRFMLDVTAGMAQLFNTVQFDSLQEMNSRKANLCFSAALHYKLNKRFLLSAQAMVSNNRYEYKSTETKNFILSRAPLVASSLPGSVDSTIKYTPFTGNYQLRSVFNCQAGLGMEAGLLRRKRLSLSCGLLVQLSMTQFKYSYSYKPSGDTLSYIKQASSPPLQNTTRKSEPESRSAQFLKTNLGVYSGLTIGYRLTHKADLIVKPGVYVDLKELKPRQITYNQNSFLLTAGIRVRL